MSLTEQPYYQQALQHETALFDVARKNHSGSPVSMKVYDVQLNDATVDDDASKSNFIHTIEVSYEESPCLRYYDSLILATQTSQAQSTAASTHDPPLVIMHGYGNGIGYLFRNLMPIADSLRSRKVFGIDMLGFGLSSRPDFHKTIKSSGQDPSSISGAESFFVESLEKWREEQKIDKMVLCGHSMGGYLSCSYASKYPERVSKLVLLSPVGVPRADEEARAERIKNAPMKFRMLFGLAASFWNAGMTPMSVLRKLPEGRGRALVDGYVFNRLRYLGKDEKVNLSGYFYG